MQRISLQSIFMNQPPSPAVDDGARKSLLGELWSFLNRDVRTFRWWQRNTPDTIAQDLSLQKPMLGTGPAPEIISEVNPKQIEALRIRREILDWRDDFHFQVTEKALQAKKALENRVEHEFANMGFLRLRLFTKPSIEVLEDHIESCVKSEMQRFSRIEETALRQRLATWLPHRHESVSIWIMWPKLELDTRLALEFKDGNRAQIMTALDEIILGENGLADRYRRWANQYASQILEMRHAQSDSI